VGQARIRRNVGANATVSDVLQGQPVRFIRAAGPVQIGLTTELTGGGDITCEVLLGGRTIATGYQVPVEATVDAGPQADRDINILAMARPGDEIIINISNSSVAPENVDTYVNVPNQ